MKEKTLFLQVQLPSNPKLRFRVESGLINGAIKWLIVERGTGAVVAYESKFEPAIALRDKLEKEFPAPERMTQKDLDTMSPDQEPTSAWRKVLWNAQRI